MFTDSTGLRVDAVVRPDGTRAITLPDSTLISVTESPDPRWGMQAPIVKSLGVKLPSGLTFSETRSRSVTLADSLNPLSLSGETETLARNGKVFTTIFNASTRQFTTTTPLKRQRVTSIDTAGRVTGFREGSLEPLRFEYDTAGRLSTIAQGSRSFRIEYDARHRPIRLIDPVNRSVGLEYNAADRVIRQTLTDGRAIAFGYDANGNLTGFTPPERPTHGFQYSPVDLVTEYDPPVLSPGSLATLYAYNPDKQLTTITRPDGATVTMGYDTGGRLASVTTPSGAVQFGYDPVSGRMQSAQGPGGQTLAFTLDGPLPTRSTWSGPVSGVLTRAFNADFRVASETAAGSAVTFTYDHDGLLTVAGSALLTRDAQTGLVTRVALGSVSEDWTLNGHAEPTRQAVKYGATTTLFDVQYTRDGLGRITQRIEAIDDILRVFQYGYDAAGRLERVVRNSVVTALYGYDANSNRVTTITPEAIIAATYDAQDRLTQYGDTTHTYTANGELATKTRPGQTTTYQYDALGNLMRVGLPDGRVIEYVVDALNRRVGKKVNGVLVRAWLYADQLRPVAELDGTGQLVARFVYGSRPNVPDYLVKGGATYRIVADHLGSPRILVNASSGVVAQRLDYDEWGAVTQDSAPGSQPFGFAGGLYDPDTGLVRFGARDYDPETGRWTAKDPSRFAGGDPNLYGYALNEPIDLFDPSGLQTCCSNGGASSYALCWSRCVEKGLGNAANYLLGLTVAGAIYGVGSSPLTLMGTTLPTGQAAGAVAGAAVGAYLWGTVKAAVTAATIGSAAGSVVVAGAGIAGAAAGGYAIGTMGYCVYQCSRNACFQYP